MLNELNKILTTLDSEKKDKSNNLFYDDNHEDTLNYLNNQFNANEVDNNNFFNLNKNSHNLSSYNYQNKIDENYKNSNDEIDDKILNQTNCENLIQHSMNNNNEKSNICSIYNENFCLVNNNRNKENNNLKERKLRNSYLNIENKILKKKKGRKKLNEISNTIRNKFAKDNINKKIKRFFLQCFLSKLIQTISDTKNIFTIRIKKFNKEIVSQTNIGFNIELFNLTLRELLKTKISKKYKIIQTRPNENVCSPKENEKILNLIEYFDDFKILLDMKLKEIYEIFTKNKEEFIKIMKSKFNINFKNNFEYYVNSEKDQKYREKLLYYGNNYEKEYLNEKDARKLRKRNNLINN